MAKPDGTYRTYAEMVAEGLATKYKGHYSTAPLCSPPDQETFQFPARPVPTYQYAVFLAEVEVDTAPARPPCSSWASTRMSG